LSLDTALGYGVLLSIDQGCHGFQLCKFKETNFKMYENIKVSRMKQACDFLQEECGFDAVQIVASTSSDDCDTFEPPENATTYFQVGYGNWYARVGLCDAFSNSSKNKELAKELKDGDAGVS
jgi:hypothetical protein